MGGDQFDKRFKDSFLRFIARKPCWKVLFFRRHRSHISLKLVKIALENFVVLIVLPPNTTYL